VLTPRARHYIDPGRFAEFAKPLVVLKGAYWREFRCDGIATSFDAGLVPQVFVQHTHGVCPGYYG